MGVVWYRLRADVRVGWRTLALIAVVVGVGGGVALTAFAGARRTSAAVPQMLAYSRPDDGTVAFGGFCPPPTVTGPAATSLAPLPGAARVLRLPQVAAFMRVPYLFFSTSASGSASASVNVTASADVQGFRAIDRPLMVAGRFPDPRRAFDAAVNELAAERLHLGVGSRLTLYAYSQKQACDLTGAAGPLPAPAGPRFTVRVVGIARLPSDVNAVVPLAAAQDVDYEGQGQVYLTPAFLSRYAAALGIAVQDVSSMNAYFVRVRGGPAGWHAFAAAAARLDRDAQLAGWRRAAGRRGQRRAGHAPGGRRSAVVRGARRARHLAAGGAGAGPAGAAGGGRPDDTGWPGDEPGPDRRHGGAAGGDRRRGWGRAGRRGGGGGLTADAGGARAPGGDLAGISVDAVVLTAGFLAVVVLLAAAAALPAWRVSRRVPGRYSEATRRAGTPPLAGLLAHSPLPLTTMIGVRFGLVTRPRPERGAGRDGAGRGYRGGDGGRGRADLRRQPCRSGWFALAAGMELGRAGRQSEHADRPRGPCAAAGWPADQLAGSYSALTVLQGGFTVDGVAAATPSSSTR